MRECGCSGELDFCAHFDGRWIIMHRVMVRDIALDNWFVCAGVGDAQMNGVNHADFETTDYFADYDTALAAFRAAEIELLRSVAIG